MKKSIKLLLAAVLFTTVSCSYDPTDDLIGKIEDAKNFVQTSSYQEYAVTGDIYLCAGNWYNSRTIYMTCGRNGAKEVLFFLESARLQVETARGHFSGCGDGFSVQYWDSKYSNSKSWDCGKGCN